MRAFSAFKAFAAKYGLRYHHEVTNHGFAQASVYSRDMKYRYAFARVWDAKAPLVLWVMLNPGTGDTELRRRPTLERCVAWSRDWSHGGILLGNLFAARAKSAKALASIQEPVGARNEEALQMLQRLAARTVAAWGNHGRRQDRGRAVQALLRDAHCLGVTAGGHPRHPLYVPGTASLVTL